MGKSYQGEYTPMYFEDAFYELKQGKAVARRSWNKGLSIKLFQTEDRTSGDYIYISTTTSENQDTDVTVDFIKYSPDQRDMLADDWFIVEETKENEMKNYIHRIMVLQQSGFGNPTQYKLIPVIKKGNHDLFAINVDFEDENFILFTRSKKEYDDIGGAIMNSNDALNIVDFIYDIAAKTYDESYGNGVRYTFEIDFGGDELLDIMNTTDIFNLDMIREIPSTPAMNAFISVLSTETGSYGKKIPDFKFIFKSFTKEDCQLYFFKGCENANTPRCCKNHKEA